MDVCFPVKLMEKKILKIMVTGLSQALQYIYQPQHREKEAYPHQLG